MAIELRLLGPTDVAAHNAGEDDETVRWLTGVRGTAESTAAHFRMLAHHAEIGTGKRGFGIWRDGELVGYVDCDPDVSDGLDTGDVNISYAVHPWARGQGVAVAAVHLMCDYMRRNKIGSHAAIRVDPGNRASVRVAEKCGFDFIREFASGTDSLADGRPAMLRLYRLKL